MWRTPTRHPPAYNPLVCRCVPAAAALLIAACLSDPKASSDAAPDGDGGRDIDTGVGTDAPCSDSDGDGYLPAGCAGALHADCAPDDEAVHPGAFEICGNSVDDDCFDGDVSCDDALSPNQVSEIGGVITVTNGAYTAELTAADNYEITSLIAHGGAPDTNELVYRGSGNERYVGIHEWLSWYTWDVGGTPPGISHVTRGEAVVRENIEWTAADGADTSGGLSGVTYYTFHPDGRIHIDHDFDVLVGGGGPLTAFVALARDEFTHADFDGNGGGPYPITGAQNVAHEDDVFPYAEYLCAYDDTAGGAAVGWSPLVGQVTDTGAGSRISESFAGTVQIALQFDWISSGSPTGARDGDFQLTVARVPDSGPPCAAPAANAAAMHDPPGLDVAEPGLNYSGGVGDDNTDGYNEGGGYFDVYGGDVSATAVELTVSAIGASLPPTSTYRIRGIDFAHDPVVELDGERLSRGHDYLFHVEPFDGHGWLYLARPIANGSVLSVEAPAP
jgi:hypothetical protein